MDLPAPTTADPTSPAHAARVGPYRLGRLIGQGTTGAVYLADDTATGERVALKLMRADHAADPVSVARFSREIRALAALAADRVPAVRGSGRSADGRVYLAMELLDGESLRARLAHGARLPLDAAVAVAQQLAEVLARAHLLGIVHRDLKPENVIVSAGPRGEPAVKLLDFGVAHLLGDGAATQWQTARGMVFGTPAYMAPEQARGRPVDGRADQYALGVMLYEMLAGRRPFVEDDPLTLLQRHVSATPPPLETLAPGVTPAVARVVARMMAKAPGARFASIDAAVIALRDAAREPAPVVADHAAHNADDDDDAPLPPPPARPTLRALVAGWQTGAAVALALSLTAAVLMAGR